MRYFNNFAFMSEKKRYNKGLQRFSGRFLSSPYNRLQNLSAAVNASRSTTRILLRGKRLEPKVKFFLHKKLPNLGPTLNELMQLKRITEAAWGTEPPIAGRFIVICGKYSNFNANSITFRTFLKLYE